MAVTWMMFELVLQFHASPTEWDKFFLYWFNFFLPTSSVDDFKYTSENFRKSHYNASLFYSRGGFLYSTHNFLS